MFFPSFIVFMCLYMSSFLIVFSCKDWMLIWLGLEINMLSFIMIVYNKYSMISIESCLKYFIIQTLGSLIFMMFIYLNMSLVKFLGCLILIYKIGGGPFYFWFPSLCMSMDWMSCYLLMIFQKIMPMLLLNNFFMYFMWLISMFSLVIGAMGSMNQFNLKCLMAYSSIHHIGWMLMSMFISDMFWMIYLLMYMFMMFGWLMYLMINKIFSIFYILSIENKLIIFMCMMNLGGIPPFLGFFLKMWSFYYFMMFEYSMMILMIMFSVMMLYIYFRMSYDLIMGSKILSSMILYSNKYNYIYMDIIYLMGFLLGSIIGLIFLY